MTNYEKIKDMSVEEMAEHLSDKIRCDKCPMLAGCFEYEVSGCLERMLDWFLKEAEE